MQQNSFFRDIIDASRTGWSLCPVQDISTVNSYGFNVNVDDAFSLLYRDLYLRQLKEELKHTMLVHESVFESQIHELHRLYQRQKELMMEMEVSRHNEALYLNSGFLSPRTHWMSSSISASHTCEENIPNQTEVVDDVEKSEKKVLDLELPVFEYNGEEKGPMNGKVPNFMNEQSLESSNQLQLDLNEPAKIERRFDYYVFDQFLSPTTTSNEIGQVSDKKNEGEDSAQDQSLSAKCRGEYGIDLNVSLLSTEEEEEATIVNKFETAKPQVSLSVSLHGEHGSKQPRVIVQALPCANSVLLLDKRSKSLWRSSRPGKKARLSPLKKTFKGSDLDPQSCAHATSESQCTQAGMEKGSLSSLSKVKSARTSRGKRRPCEQQMNFSNFQNVATRKRGRTKRKKSRRLSLVTEGNYQEISAAVALVDMSRKSGREISDCITSLSSNLLWLAEISTSVAEDYEIDDFEGMTLHLPVKEHKRSPRMKSAEDKTAVSSIVRRRQRRSRTRQGKRKVKDGQHGYNTILGMLSECEANEDLIEKVTEASESEWACGLPENKSKSSPPKPLDAFISLVEENLGVDWGVITKRRRGSRVPATDFQQMIINQVVV